MTFIVICLVDQNYAERKNERTEINEIIKEIRWKGKYHVKRRKLNR